MTPKLPSLFFAVAVLFVSGCAGTAKIKDLPLPPVTVIEGSVTQLDAHGFTLADDSGAIRVNAELPNQQPLKVSLHERLRVYGNLQGRQARVFEGYVLRKASGEQVVVTKPIPHFGCLIQTAFE